jgi:hypothetical protein
MYWWPSNSLYVLVALYQLVCIGCTLTALQVVSAACNCHSCCCDTDTAWLVRQAVVQNSPLWAVRTAKPNSCDDFECTVGRLVDPATNMSVGRLLLLLFCRRGWCCTERLAGHGGKGKRRESAAHISSTHRGCLLSPKHCSKTCSQLGKLAVGLLSSKRPAFGQSLALLSSRNVSLSDCCPQCWGQQAWPAQSWVMWVCGIISPSEGEHRLCPSCGCHLCGSHGQRFMHDHHRVKSPC